MDMVHLDFKKTLIKLFIFCGDRWQLTGEEKRCLGNLCETLPTPTATTPSGHCLDFPVCTKEPS